MSLDISNWRPTLVCQSDLLTHHGSRNHDSYNFSTFSWYFFSTACLFTYLYKYIYILLFLKLFLMFYVFLTQVKFHAKKIRISHVINVIYDLGNLDFFPVNQKEGTKFMRHFQYFQYFQYDFVEILAPLAKILCKRKYIQLNI